MIYLSKLLSLNQESMNSMESKTLKICTKINTVYLMVAPVYFRCFFKAQGRGSQDCHSSCMNLLDRASCWISAIRKHEVACCRRGRPMNTWSVVVSDDLRMTGLVADMTRNQNVWKRAVKKSVTLYPQTSRQTVRKREKEKYDYWYQIFLQATVILFFACLRLLNIFPFFVSFAMLLQNHCLVTHYIDTFTDL